MNSIQTLLTDHIDLWTAADTEKKSGRGRSSGNAASVYGIKKLRELILELAVRGKLVPQDANDEPASALLKRIQTEKAKLIAEDKIKKDKPLAPITEDEKPFELPQGWEWTRVAQVGHDWGQKTPNSDFTYIEVSAIDSQRGIVSSPELVKPENAPSRARKVVKKGSVIYSTIRPYLLNVAVIEDDFSPEPIASTAFAIVHPFCLMPPRYFLCFFRSPVFVRHVESVQMGIAYPAINDGQFFSSLIPLPPIEEQHRIVAKVDELMALCDQLEQQQTLSIEAHQTLVASLLGTLTQIPVRGELVEPHSSTSSGRTDFEENWQRIASHFDTLFTTEASIDQLKQTIIQLAVMGKLVPQDPIDKLGEKLLVAPKKAEKNKHKWAEPIEEQEKPFQLPPSWIWLRLGDISSLKHGYAFNSKFFTSEAAPFVLTTPGNFYEKGGFRDRESKRKYYSGPVDPEFILKPGDLIIPMTEQAAGLLGSPAFIPDDGRVYIHNQRLGKLNFSEAIAPEFAFWFFNCEFFRGELSRTCTGMKVRHTSPDRVLKVPFPVCPLAEQNRIVAKVGELMALCDALKERLADAQAIQLHLADAIVEQAVC